MRSLGQLQRRLRISNGISNAGARGGRRNAKHAVVVDGGEALVHWRNRYPSFWRGANEALLAPRLPNCRKRNQTAPRQRPYRRFVRLDLMLTVRSGIKIAQQHGEPGNLSSLVATNAPPKVWPRNPSR